MQLRIRAFHGNDAADIADLSLRAWLGTGIRVARSRPRPAIFLRCTHPAILHATERSIQLPWWKPAATSGRQWRRHLQDASFYLGMMPGALLNDR